MEIQLFRTQREGCRKNQNAVGLPGGNYADAHQRSVEGTHSARPDDGNEAVRRTEKVDWPRFTKGTDNAAPSDGGERPAQSKGLVLTDN